MRIASETPGTILNAPVCEYRGLRGRRKNASRHILINLTEIKHKERILKAAREKQQVTYKGKPIQLTVDLSAETLQARREWQDVFKVLKEKILQP